MDERGLDCDNGGGGGGGCSGRPIISRSLVGRPTKWFGRLWCLILVWISRSSGVV